MNEDEEELARRQQALDERERALLNREEELAREERASPTGRPGNGPREGLGGRPPLVAESPRRSLAFLFVFLAALALLGWVLLRGNPKAKNDVSAELPPFELRKTAGLNLDTLTPSGPVPSAAADPVPSPSPDQAADRLQQQEQELLLARRRAPIVIMQAAGPGPHAPGTAGAAPNSGASGANPVELPNLDRMLAVDASRLEAVEHAPAGTLDPNAHFQRQLGKSPVRNLDCDADRRPGFPCSAGQVHRRRWQRPR